MSTSATVAQKRKDGSYSSIYVHNSGGIEGVGRWLKTYMDHVCLVNDLLDLGNCSQLILDGKYPKVNAYIRDWGRSQKDEAAHYHDNLRELADYAHNTPYLYLWDNDKWYCYKSGDLLAF